MIKRTIGERTNPFSGWREVFIQGSGEGLGWNRLPVVGYDSTKYFNTIQTRPSQGSPNQGFMTFYNARGPNGKIRQFVRDGLQTDSFAQAPTQRQIYAASQWSEKTGRPYDTMRVGRV